MYINLSVIKFDMDVADIIEESTKVKNFDIITEIWTGQTIFVLVINDIYKEH